MRRRCERARALVQSNTRITVADRERLLGYLEGTGVSILPEPQVLLTATPEGAGTRWAQDVQVLRQYHRAARGAGRGGARSCATMQTDPARVRRTDPGDPEKCPVWDLHKIYSDEATRQWVERGLPQRRHRLPGLQEAADREDRRGDQRHAQARAGIRGQPGAGAPTSSPKARRRRAKRPAQTLDEVRRAMHLRAE